MVDFANKIWNKPLLLKVKFLSADKDGWDYLKGPAEKIEVDSDITLEELSDEIRLTFAIPEGRNHAFYMSDTVRPPFDHVYRDRQENEVYNQEKGIRLQDAMIAPKFKYEYSFTEGLLFQITLPRWISIPMSGSNIMCEST